MVQSQSNGKITYASPMEGNSTQDGPIRIYEALVREWFLDAARITPDKEASIIKLLGGRPGKARPTPMAHLWWIDCLCVDGIRDMAAEFCAEFRYSADRIRLAAQSHGIKLSAVTEAFLATL